MRSRLAGLLVAGWFAGGFVGAADAPTFGADARSTERLSYVCEGSLGQRDITLFANGTVRLREGLWDERVMYLAELGPDELNSVLAVLDQWTTQRREESPGARPSGRNPGGGSGVFREPPPVAWERSKDPRLDLFGDWVERCELNVAIPGRDSWSFEYTVYDVPPLEIERVVQIAEELVAELGPERKALPVGYRPTYGDVLRDAEGERYRVLRLTSDGVGVELEGLDQPLRIFVALADLPVAFKTLDGDGDPTAFNPGEEPGRGVGMRIDDSDAEDEDDDDGENPNG